MHTRDLVKKTFANEGLYKLRNRKIVELLRAIDDQPMDCWPEFVARFRRDYYDLFDRIVPPLMKTGDQLIAAVLLHHADLTKPKERALLTKYVQDADEQDNEGILIQIAKRNDAELNLELAKKRLTPNVRAVLAKQTPKKKKATNVTVTPRDGNK